MPWTVTALIVTVLIGGLIAYSGDLIGRRFGKRRVSIFNLRPRHTAVLITCVTGVFISAATTGALFLVVPAMRNVILRGEAALNANQKLRIDNSALSRQQVALAGETRDAIGKLETAKVKAVKAEAALYKADLAEAKAEKSVRISQVDLLKARQNVQIAADRAVRLRAEEARLGLRVGMLKQRNVELLHQARQYVARNAIEAARSTELQQKLAALVVEIGSKERDNQAYDASNALISAQNVQLGNQRDALSQVVQRLKATGDSLAAANRDLEQKNSELRTAGSNMATQYQDQWDKLTREFDTIRTGRIAIHGGDDLARIVIPAGSRAEDIRKSVLDLMHRANQRAIGLGARSDETSPTLAVHVVSKQFYTEGQGGALRRVDVTEADRIDALVNKVATAGDSVCILALAVANSAENQPAAIDFQPFNNRLIYPSGRVVGWKQVDSTEAPERLFMDLRSFLKELGQNAVVRGVIPQIDPSTGTPLVGAMDWPELVKLVERVRSAGGTVKVTAKSARDIYAADALKMDFQISPAN